MNQNDQVLGTYAIFLDDHRNPPRDGRNWKIARSYSQFFQLVQEIGINWIQHISFDHDLGKDKVIVRNQHLIPQQKIMTGYDCARDLAAWLIDISAANRLTWIGDRSLDFRPDFSYEIHSQNPVGRDNIKAIMDLVIDNYRTYVWKVFE